MSDTPRAGDADRAGRAGQRVVELRLDFDRAFAAAPALGQGARAAYLAIRIGGDPFALRLSDLMGIHVDRKVVPVPSAAPTLLGIASFRGALTPVHDLRLLLGYPARAPARWLARVAGGRAAALAFEALEGQFLVGAGDGDGAVAAGPGAGPTRAAAYTRGVVQARDGLRPVIDVAAAVAAVLINDRGGARAAAER